MAPRRSEQSLRRAMRWVAAAGLLCAAVLLAAPATGFAHPGHAYEHAPGPPYLAQIADEKPGARQDMPKDERRRLEKRVEEWQQLSPDERKRIRKGHEQLQQLPPNERERVRKNFDRWQQFSPEEREQMRQRHERFEKLPPDQRKKLRERGRSEGHRQDKKQRGSKREKRKKSKQGDR